MLLVLMNLFFLWRVDYALEENIFDFAYYFILRGRDMHIDYLRLLFLVGIIFFDLFWNVKLFIAGK